MRLTAREIAGLVNGELTGDPDQVVTGLAGVREAQPGDVAFVANRKYFAAARNCRAALLILPRDAVVEFAGGQLRVDDPTAAFAQLAAHVAPATIKHAPGISAQAVVHPSAQIGSGVSIQPFAVIEPEVTVGDHTVIGAGCYLGHGSHIGTDCILYPSVTLREGTVLGDRVVLHAGVVLGADGFGFEFKGGKHEKIPQLGTVEIGDDVEIGANSAIDRGRFGKTRVGRGTKIDNLVQIGHNCVIGEHCIVCGLVGMAGSTIVGNYVTIAGQVGIAGHLTIGDKAIIMAQAGVTKDVERGEILLGAPAVPHKQFKQAFVALQHLPQTVARLRELEKTVERLREQVEQASSDHASRGD